MNDALEEPQFEHEEPAAQHKKRTKKKRPRDNDEDDDATPGAPPILEESAAAAAEPASTAPVTFQTAGGPAKKPRPPRAAPRDGAAWAAWLRNLLPDADAAALPARCAPPEGDVKMAVAARVRRGQQGRAVDVVVVCTSARRAADLARTLRDHAKIRRVFKLFGKHKDRKEQERALATLSPLPRVAVATPARLDALRDRVPWAPGAALLVDGAPDAKGYTPFTLPDAKGALAATVAGLLGATDVAFGVVES
mmetsp:Transcript_24321/g.63394  ORF Transcript_24321/g.63394 Transcript_24321/m.63394 type:complete len:251 (+) Transcript_24321:2-754(+)